MRTLALAPLLILCGCAVHNESAVRVHQYPTFIERRCVKQPQFWWPWDKRTWREDAGCPRGAVVEYEPVKGGE